ncbi:3-phosphoserine/phosphohydroxythreonine transaminase [Alicyclobacillus tolerans]|uniref:3-phosphoserine/phosphohydroxythreonine transaminase n=1 Tax=Alicyclobacillus tolerans TaxID=90970 RepID=UPI001F011695|nr:3-phosphoserine/phosphohydroxythreonine transaminase [Alicyclobacillus tolerans]MCF8564518.1 3-phosphoserine/phosphohydroxythreonine transaminase [Alicyclobacillus tolerans]
MPFEREQASNFGAGPAAIPTPVLEQAQAELLNFRGTGMSIMEISHRNQAYAKVQEEAEASLRDLLSIPTNYRVLFLQGGASLQFSMIPMNWLSAGQTAGYVLTGSWSEKAQKEAALFGTVRVAASTKEEGYKRIPNVQEIALDANDRYLHITSNNTIFGSQWAEYPDTGHVPLIADMSSDILSRPIPVEKFGLIYAGAQKNLGPSGLTVVIVRDDLVEAANKELPTMLRYDIHAKNDSRYNTPPTFGIYMLSLVLQWAKERGGVSAIARENEAKAGLIYDAIDNSQGFYNGYVAPDSRSKMNVTFRLATEELEKVFLDEAKASGLIGLNGHRSVGGCRASLYNAVSIKDCERLAAFMLDFQKRNG